MIKEKFDNYKKNKKELTLVEKSLDKLNARLLDVPEVSVKVQKSGDDFPYIEGHVSVKAAEPKEATRIKDKIREKEARRDALKSDIDAVDEFICRMSDGIEKQILEMVYLDGMSQREVGESIGYTKGRVSQVISKTIKD